MGGHRLLSQGLAPSAWTLGSCSWQRRLLALEWPQGCQETVSREAWDRDSSPKGTSVGPAACQVGARGGHQAHRTGEVEPPAAPTGAQALAGTLLGAGTSRWDWAPLPGLGARKCWWGEGGSRALHGRTQAGVRGCWRWWGPPCTQRLRAPGTRRGGGGAPAPSTGFSLRSRTVGGAGLCTPAGGPLLAQLPPASLPRLCRGADRSCSPGNTTPALRDGRVGAQARLGGGLGLQGRRQDSDPLTLPRPACDDRAPHHPGPAQMDPVLSADLGTLFRPSGLPLGWPRHPLPCPGGKTPLLL